jgi:hypothetical protein
MLGMRMLGQSYVAAGPSTTDALFDPLQEVVLSQHTKLPRAFRNYQHT